MRDLATEVHEGMVGAVEELLRTYQDRIFSYTLRMLGNHFDAQEVTQDTFIRAHRALAGQYSRERCRTLALRPWLFRIAHNLSRNRLRAQRNAAENRRGESIADMEPELKDSRNPAEALAGREARNRLLQAIGQLAADHREVVLLRFMHEMSYAEVASATGTTEAAARGKVHRALRRLRTTLDRGDAQHAMQ